MTSIVGTRHFNYSLFLFTLSLLPLLFSHFPFSLFPLSFCVSCFDNYFLNCCNVKNIFFIKLCVRHSFKIKFIGTLNRRLTQEHRTFIEKTSFRWVLELHDKVKIGRNVLISYVLNGLT